MTGPVPDASHVPSLLMRQTLLDRELVKAAEQPVLRLLPWLDVVVIGGTAIIDRGPEIIRPLVEEVRGALRGRKLLILTGAGIRARHVLGVGLDLGLPTGALSALAATEAEMNGHMIAALLAADGVSYIPHGTVARQLATHLAACPAVVSNAYPPYGPYEFPTAAGRIPSHRTDAGALLLADALGARTLIYVKDVDGIHDETGRARTRVPASAVLGSNGSPVDRLAPELLGRAKHMREFQIINGLVRGALPAALDGETVGTVVHVG